MTIDQNIFMGGQVNLDIFIDNLANLRYYINELELQKEIISNSVVEECNSESLLRWISEYKSKFDIMRRFNYNSMIISLYGFVEQYIESLIKSYLSLLNETIPCYKQLPDPISKNHISYSIELINRVTQSHYKGDIDPNDIISNLNSCIGERKDYRINVDAFSYHTANFRSGLIKSQFDSIGVKNVSERVVKCPLFIDYFRDERPGDAPSLSYLDELVDHRNDVAHGTLPYDIQTNDIILGYVQFFEVYGRALYEIIRSEALCFVANHCGISLGRPAEVFNHKIVCISIRNTPVEVGDWLIAKTNNSDVPYLASPIEKIEVDGVDHKSVPSYSLIDIGMQISFKAKKNHEFYLVPKNRI